MYLLNLLFQSEQPLQLVLVEEAENVSDESWKKLLPSIRPKSGRAVGNEMNLLDLFVCFQPVEVGRETTCVMRH